MLPKFNCVPSPPVKCPMCKENMYVTGLQIENNIDNFVYGKGNRAPILIPTKQEITLELKCHRCHAIGKGIAKEIETTPNQIWARDVVIEKIQGNAGFYEDEFNPSER